MATDTAQLTAPPEPTAPPVRRLRQLWQLPTFILGVAALAAVWFGRPYWQPEPVQQCQRELHLIRRALEPAGADLTDVVARSLSVLDRIEQLPASPEVPPLKAEAHFLLGSAYLRQAEAPEGTPASWQSARAYLEKAAEMGPSEADRHRLDYRLAKVWQHLGHDPQQVLEMLRRSLDAADDPAEAHRLLAEAYLKQPIPDPAAALMEFEQLLKLPTLEPRTLAPARLQAGELYLALRDPDHVAEGRRLLERVDTDAPPELFVAARSRLARSYQDDKEWTQAVRHWEAIKDTPHQPAAERRAVCYQLAVCYREANRLLDAEELWEKLLPSDGEAGDEIGQASAWKLVELRVANHKTTTVLPALELALRGIEAPTDYRNPLLPAVEAVGICERAISACQEEGAYDLAQRLAGLYGRLVPGRDRELAATSADAAAQALLDLARQEKIPERARQREAEAVAQYKLAAAAYRAVAERRKAEEQAPWLRLAADRSLKARDWQTALAVFEKLTKLPSLPAKEIGEVWFLKAEAHRALEQKQAAGEAYQFSLQNPGPFAPRARLQVALLHIEDAQRARAAGRAEDADALQVLAMEELKPNLDPPTPPDRETHEQSLYELADLLYQRRDYRAAEDRLQSAIKLYPENPHGLQARFQLGRCWWFQALQEYRSFQETPDAAAKQQRLARYRDLLKKAAEPFAEIERQLQRKQAETPALPEAEVRLLRQASFAAAECHFFLEDFVEADRRYRALAFKYQGQVEELVALSQLWQCYGFQLQKANDPAIRQKAADTLARIGKTLAKMPDDAFNGSTEIHKRAYWEDWLKKTAK